MSNDAGRGSIRQGLVRVPSIAVLGLLALGLVGGALPRLPFSATAVWLVRNDRASTWRLPLQVTVSTHFTQSKSINGVTLPAMPAKKMRCDNGLRTRVHL